MTAREDWIGRVGQEWARRTDALERLLGPAGEAGLVALAPKPGESVLDLGCGSGASTARLADAVGPEGRVIGIDISPDLLAGRANVELVESDAARHAFPPASQDALFSRFGAMFFDDPPAAFANLRRALRPGARAVFVAWRPARLNAWAAIPLSVAPEGAASPELGPGPFAWAEPDTWRPLLEGAGFAAVAAETHDYPAEISEGDDPDPVARAIAFMTRIGPLASRLRDAPADARRAALEALAGRLSDHVEGGAVRLAASAWVIEARAVG